MIKIILVYLALANIVGFVIMGIDKGRAKKGKWRIPEKTLFLASLLGGSLGTWGGMYFFRHKTKHWYFVIGMPAILILQIAAVLWLMNSTVFSSFVQINLLH